MYALRLGALTGIVCALLAAAAPVHAQAVGIDARVEATVEADLAPEMPALPALDVSAPAINTGEDRSLLARSFGVDLETTARANVGSSTGSGEDAAFAAQAAAAIPEPVRAAAPGVIATVGVIALAQSFGAFRLAAVGAFALYSRLSKSELLDNKHRDKVYKLVQERPGIALTEIGATLGLGWGTTIYHLDRLERAGFVATERSGMRRCCFPVGLVPRENRASLGALQADTTRTLAEYLAGNPGATQSQVCEALGMSASAASKQVTKLETAGLLRREREWKTVHLWPAPELSGLLSPGADSRAAELTPTTMARALTA